LTAKSPPLGDSFRYPYKFPCMTDQGSPNGGFSTLDRISDHALRKLKG